MFDSEENIFADWFSFRYFKNFLFALINLINLLDSEYKEEKYIIHMRNGLVYSLKMVCYVLLKNMKSEESGSGFKFPSTTWT